MPTNNSTNSQINSTRTFVGVGAGNLTTTTNNTAFGAQALDSITSGSANLAVGFNALKSVTGGSSNVALGPNALFSNTSSFNTAVGDSALRNTGIGGQNTAVGADAAFSNTDGSNNTVVGALALQNNTTGNDNTVVGSQSSLLTVGSQNTIIGSGALPFCPSGDNNTALGYNTLGGASSSSNNIAIGVNAGSNYSTEINNIVIAHPGTASDSGVIRIGNGYSACYISGIAGVSVSNTQIVTIDSSATQLGSVAAIGVANGGTGSSSFNTTGVVISGATSTTALTAITLTDGQLPIGSSAGNPAAATLTAGTGISITNGHNSITISAISAGFTWSNKSANFNAAAENGYFVTATCAATLPASPSNGDTIRFFVDGAATLTVTANTGQKIKVSTSLSASAGTAANTNNGDSLEIVYRSTDTQWNALSFVGSWTVT